MKQRKRLTLGRTHFRVTGIRAPFATTACGLTRGTNASYTTAMTAVVNQVTCHKCKLSGPFLLKLRAAAKKSVPPALAGG